MLLKDHLKEVFNMACSENNSFIKEIIISKWVHRFGFDSLNELLLESPFLEKECKEEENQEQITLIEKCKEEENQEQISLIEECKEEENQEQISLIEECNEEKKCESIELEKFRSEEIITKKETFAKKRNEYYVSQKSPLPHIKNLRKWINNDKKAS